MKSIVKHMIFGVIYLLFTKKKDIRERLFSIDERQDKFIRACNRYLQSGALFNSLKTKIKDVRPSFITDDIMRVKIDRSFDNIWLSNIATYGFSLDDVLKIFKKYQQSLNDDGRLLLSYLYDTTEGSKYEENWDIIYNIPKIKEMLGCDNFEIKSFIGTYGIVHDINKIKDSVLVYKKRNK